MNLRDTILDLNPGETLCGRYELVRRVGLGAMAVVWLAIDHKLNGLSVALKVLPIHLGQDRRAIAMLMAEAERSLRLTHPNIVRLHTFDQDQGRRNVPFLVMQYVEGETLAGIIEKHPNGLPLNQVRPWFKQIAAAVDHAHGEGILHRDIKPSNIVIDSASGTAFLMDFGIAREMRDSMTRISGDQDSSGTLLYMSPQQLDGTDDASNDIYSLAVTFYEAISGQPPFVSGDIRGQIMNTRPASIPGVSPSVRDAIEVGLSKEKNERPSSARQFIANVVDETNIVVKQLQQDEAVEAESPFSRRERGPVFDSSLSAPKEGLEVLESIEGRVPTGAYTIERRVGCSVSTAWNTLLESENFHVWMRGWSAYSNIPDRFTTGTRFKRTVIMPDRSSASWCVIGECNPHKLIEFNWGGACLRVELRELAGGTAVRFSKAWYPNGFGIRSALFKIMNINCAFSRQEVTSELSSFVSQCEHNHELLTSVFERSSEIEKSKNEQDSKPRFYRIYAPHESLLAEVYAISHASGLIGASEHSSRHGQTPSARCSLGSKKNSEVDFELPVTHSVPGSIAQSHEVFALQGSQPILDIEVDSRHADWDPRLVTNEFYCESLHRKCKEYVNAAGASPAGCFTVIALAAGIPYWLQTSYSAWWFIGLIPAAIIAASTVAAALTWLVHRGHSRRVRQLSDSLRQNGCVLIEPISEEQAKTPLAKNASES